MVSLLLGLAVFLASAGPAAAVSYLYWTNSSGGIGRVNLADPSIDYNDSWLSDSSSLSGVAADGTYIYWADSGTSSIERAELGEYPSKDSMFSISGQSSIAGVAVDDTYIYWANSSGNSIARAELANPSGVSSYWIGMNCQSPAGVAVDDTYIYWANSGGDAIERAPLGDSPTASMSWIGLGCDSPAGVAVDDTYIYWANSGTNSIARAPLGDWPTPSPYWISGCSSPTAIAVDGTYIYWVNSGDNTIGRANIDGSEPAQNWFSECSSPVWIAVPQVAALYYYRSAGTGNWSDTATWEQSLDDTSWEAATAAPSGANLGITIQDGHTVTVDADTTVSCEPDSILGTPFTIASGGTLIVADGKTLTVGDYVRLEVWENLTVTGTLSVEPFGSVSCYSGSTVVFNGANQTIPWIMINDNLQFSGSGTKTLTFRLDLSGNLTIGSGVTLDVSSSNYAVNVAGNWTNNGTFTAQNGTVTLDGTAQSITGDTTFYNLTKNVTAAATLTFAAVSTTTVSNTLTLQGADSQLLSLRSSSAGTQWKIDAQGTRTLAYLDVKDSNNTSGTTMDADGFTDSGNNTDWSFGAGDTTAPTLSSTSATSVTSSGVTLNFTSDEAGTYYYLVYAAADAAPDAATVKAQGDAVAKGTDAATAAANTAAVTGLSASTAYKAYVIVEDAASNASAVSTISFTTSGAPEIAVFGKGVEIADGDTSGSIEDDTYFGAVERDGGSSDRTYTITNSGTATLNLTGAPLVSITGAHAVDFTVTTQPSTSTIAPGGSTTFTVHYDPSVMGGRIAYTSIPNDDADENPYDFQIYGQSTADITAPALSDTSATSVTASGATLNFTSSEAGTYYYLVYAAADAAPDAATVKAQGDAVAKGTDTATASANTADVTGLSASTAYKAYVIVEDAVPNASAVSTIELTTTAAAPEIAVFGKGVEIADGDTSGSIEDDTYFGAVERDGGSSDRTYTITNSGTATLNLTGTPLVSLTGPHTVDFTVTTQPSTSSIAPGGSTTFTVHFDPSVMGGRIVYISIPNDDADENPYDFQIYGHGTADITAPTLSDTSATSVTASGATLNFTSDEAGTYYYLVYAAADSAPDAPTVKAQGAAVAKGTAAATAAANTAAVTGLSASTAYKAYVIVEDAAGNKSAVSTIELTTTAGFSPAHGYPYELATAPDATVIGGADVPFSSNGPLDGVTHTATMTSIVVPTTGTYLVKYGVNITAGIGGAIAVAVNGTVDASTNTDILVSTGECTGSALLTLTAGDVLTLRNNSATAFTMDLAPGVGAQMSVVQMSNAFASGYPYELATVADATVLGGADVPFSNNGPLTGVTHTAGTASIAVPTAGTYLVSYGINITAGIGGVIAVAVNGTVDASTNTDILVATGKCAGSALLPLEAGDVLTLRNNSATAFTMDLAPGVGARMSVIQMNDEFASGYPYELATVADATVIGGADVPFSNNGPLTGVTHTAGTVSIVVPTAGTYLVSYGINITAGVGGAIAVAVNGTVDASTNTDILVATGECAGSALLTLTAGDVLTLRNNSATALTMDLAPGVGAQMSVVQLKESLADTTAAKVELTGPGSVSPDTVSTAFTLESQTAAGVATAVEADTVFDLSSDSTGTATFYSDAAGTTAITQVTITSGTSTETFYYKDTQTGTPMITAAYSSGGTDLGSDTYQVTVSSATTVVEMGGDGDVVQIEDVMGGDTNDNLTVTVVGGNLRFHDPDNELGAGPGATQVDAHTILVPLASVTGGFVFNGSGGDDVFIVDLAAGNPIPAGGMTFAGGDGFDEIAISNGVATLVVFAFVNPNDGSVTIDGSVVTYTGLEPVTSTVTAANVTLDFTGGAETITVTDAGGGQTTVDSTLGESVTFNNPTDTLTINAGTGDDIINITSLAGNYPADVIINGGDAADTITVNGNISLAGDLTVTSADLTVADNRDLTVGGDASFSDAVNLGPNSSLQIDGSGTFSGAVTLAGTDPLPARLLMGDPSAGTNTADLTFTGAVNWSYAVVYGVGTGQVLFNAGSTTTGLSNVVFYGGTDSGGSAYAVYSRAADVTWNNLSFDCSQTRTFDDSAPDPAKRTTVQITSGNILEIVDAQEDTSSTPVWMMGDTVEIETSGTITWNGSSSDQPLLTPAYGLVSSVGEADTGGIIISWTVDFESGVARYEVERRCDGIWVSVGSVAAHGAGKIYSITDPAGTSGDRYRIISVDVTGFRQTFAAGENADGSKDWYLQLEPGWNMVSLPCIANDIGELESAVDSVLWSWDSETSTYALVEGIPPPLTGLWCLAPDSCEVRISGFEPETATVHLEAGWNLFGPAENCPAPDGVETIWTWETTYRDILGDPDYPGLIQGKAYWFFASEPMDIGLPEREEQ